ncbi:MAG TPA: hypothetical protein VMH22_10815 [bacterium]|nr:hypothetical protein [bacterium]
MAMTKPAVFAVAAIAFLGMSCTSPTGPIYPMTVGSAWNMSECTLHGTTSASLDTSITGTQTTTALGKANLFNGREVTKFRDDATDHYRAPDTIITTTSYFCVTEVGDTIFSYADLSDTVGVPMMRSTPAEGQTWTQGSATATVVGQEDVRVPAGVYRDAWKVKLTSSAGGVTEDVYEWFARGTGMVKVSYDYTANGKRTVYDAALTSATIK